MIAWEYMALYEHSFPQGKLDALGKEGWELVFVGWGTYILKRPLETTKATLGLGMNEEGDE